MPASGDKIKIRVQNADYFVTGGAFSDLLTVVKNLPNRRFVLQQKLWAIDASLEMVKGQVENSGFFLEGGTPVPEDATPPIAATDDRIKIETASFGADVTGAGFQDMLTAIKDLPERRFDGNTKRWTLSGTMMELKNYFEQKGMRLDKIEAKTTPPPQPEKFALPVQNELPPIPDSIPFFDDDDMPFDEPLDGGADFFGSPPPPTPMPPAETTPETAKPAPRRNNRRDQIRVKIGQQSLVIVGGTFQEMLTAVKDIPGRRFDGASKQWILTDDISSVQQHLNAKGLIIEEDV